MKPYTTTRGQVRHWLAIGAMTVGEAARELERFHGYTPEQSARATARQEYRHA